MSREKAIFRLLVPAGLGALLLCPPPGARAQEERGPYPPAEWPAAQKEKGPAPASAREEKSGTFEFREGMRLKLATDLGSVKLLTSGADARPGQLSYKVTLEAEPDQPESAMLLKKFAVLARQTPEGVTLTGHAPWRQYSGRIWVRIEITLPRTAHVEVSTQAGNIEAQDLDGKTALYTAGGNIVAGKLGSATAGAKLETLGGHITVGDVGGSLTATTGGGHITAGIVQGDAWLRTGGGHLRLASVAGQAQLETAGGNISVQKASTGVQASTGGGKIEFGYVSGAIRARTGGGGIRVANLTGPTDLQTSAGSIYLTRVSGAVNASTSAGGITAWFVQEEKGQGASQLSCGAGDIVVYLPRELAITIDALIENGNEYRIDADPSLPIKILPASTSGGSPAVRAEGALNGGGQLLKLRTVAGNIRLKYADLKKPLPPPGSATFNPPTPPPEVFYKQSSEKEYEARARELAAREEARRIERELEREMQQIKREMELSRIQEWDRKIRGMLGSTVKISAEEQKNRLVDAPPPIYPERARWDRVQGIVRLEVEVDKEGAVKDIRVVSGHPLLVRAATDAVRLWKYEPLRVDGKALNVRTTVHIEFKLK